MWRIRYPLGAPILHVSRILRVNPAARPARGAGGAAGTGVTSPGERPGPGEAPEPVHRKDGVMFPMEALSFPRVTVRGHPVTRGEPGYGPPTELRVNDL